MTTKTESNLSSTMPSKSSTLPFQQSNQTPLIKSTMNENQTSIGKQTKTNDFDINLQSPTHQRRLPLPKNLTFEQNITNLIEHESPLLQSELLTAEHELSVLRSRLAVNEGVTAVTGTILRSLKEQFEPRHKVDTATSPLDIYKHSLFQHSLASQTSPMIETLPEMPESVEIHYDAQTPKSPCLVVKAKNSFWIAQPVGHSEAETQLKKFTSPVMKRATVKLPTSFDQAFVTDSDTEDEPIIEKARQTTQYRSSEGKSLTIENVRRLSNEHIQNLKQNETTWSTEVLAPSVGEESTTSSQANEKLVRQGSSTEQDDNIFFSTTERSSTIIDDKVDGQISPEDERLYPDIKEQKSEMKTIRSSSLLPIEDQFEQFDDKIDEIYSIIDYLKHNKLTSTNVNNIHRKINDLKSITSAIQLTKQDELRIEYELDELENLFRKINDNLTNQIHQQEDYSLIELFEQNVNELRRIINHIKSTQSHPHVFTTIKSDESKTIIEELPQKDLTIETKPISHTETDWSPEQMAELFHRGPNGQLLQSQQSRPQLIPEDPVITRDVFFEGDKSIQEKKISLKHVTHLIPEDARISADSFYEGDIHRSLYHTENEKDKETHIHDQPLIPENPLVSSDVFYEGDPQRSMFIERPSLTQIEKLTPSSPPPSSIDNLRDIMGDLMLAASWSKKPTKTDEQETKQDEEILAESFITTEQRYPPSSLCEIVHEIENFPLSSSQRLSQPTVQLEDRDTISPFSTETPIIIHRTILTRQETDRWPQDELTTGDEQVNEDVLKTNEFEQIVNDIQQQDDNWMNSSNQRKEIYGEQYRPERKLSEITQQFITDDTDNLESKQEIEQSQDESDQHHIEQTWSTDKTHSPYESEQEEDEYELQQRQISDEVIAESPVTSQHGDQFQQPSTFQQIPVTSSQEIDEDEPKAEDEFKLERKLSTEEIVIQSPTLSEHEDQHEQQYQLEDEASLDQMKIENIEQGHQQTLIKTPEEVSQQKQESEDQYESEQKSSTDEIIVESSEILVEEKQEDHEPFRSERVTVETQAADEDKPEQKLIDDNLTLESPHESEQEEEEEQYQPEQKYSADQIAPQSFQEVEPKQYKQSSAFEQVPDDSHQEIDDEGHESQGEYQHEQKTSSEKISIESPQISEHEDQEEEDQESRYKSEEQLSSDQIMVESSETMEQEEDQYKQASSDKQTVIIPRDETEDIKPDADDDFTLERKLSTDEIVTQSPTLSEHEEEQYRSVRQTSSEQMFVEPSQTIKEKEEELEYEQVETADEEKLEAQDVIIETPYEIEDQRQDEVSVQNIEKIEEENRTASITSDKEEDEQKIQYEKELSTEEVTTEPFSTTEPQDDQQYQDEVNLQTSGELEKEEESKSLQSSEHEEEIIKTSQKIEKDELEPKEYVSEQKPSSVKFIVSSAPSSEEEEKETHEYEDEFHTELSHKEDEEIEEKLESVDFAESFEQKYYQHEYTIKSSDEIKEDKPEQKLNVHEIIVESPHESEHEEEDEQYQTEEKHSIDHTAVETPEQIVTESPQLSEHEEEEYQYQSERKQSPADQIIVEDKQQSQYELEQSTSAGEASIEYSQDDEILPETSEKLQYPYESTLSQDESFLVESSSFRGEEDENKPLKRPEEWTRSAFQRDEIYGDRYRPTKYNSESSEIETQLSSDYPNLTEHQSPVTSHVQRSNIISRTIATYPDEEEPEEQEESDFRPTHLDISMPDETAQQLDTEINLSPSDESMYDENDQYEKLLYETSADIVDQILNDAVREIVEQESNLSLYQTATGIVNDVLDSIYTKYDDEIISSQREEATSADVSLSDLTDWSTLVKNVPEKPTITTSSGSDHEEVVEEETKDQHVASDDEERGKTIPQTIDQPYLSVADVITSKLREESGDLAEELQTLEQQINEDDHIIRSSSPSASSSISENDEVHHYDLSTSRISTDQLKEPTEQLDDVTTQQPEILQSSNTDELSQDIIKYRRDSLSTPSDNYSHRTERRPSSPPTSPLLKQEFVHITCSSMSDVDEVQQQLQNEQEENRILQDMIDTIIRQAQENIQSDVSIKN
jgi:hypothetical protein